MKFIRKAILLLFVCLSVVGCSNETPQPASHTPSAPANEALEKLSGAPTWSLEVVGSIVRSEGQQVFEVPASGPFAISGWAVDSRAKTTAGGVDLIIDGKSWSATYGTARADVAKFFGISEYEKSGFAFNLKPEEVGAGKHEVTLRVLSNDRKAYWESAPYTVVLK